MEQHIWLCIYEQIGSREFLARAFRSYLYLKDGGESRGDARSCA
ncbi:hypothetical protein FOXYSP1_06600 [Fusarium oxysporum f. sp. phaseoli]